jgi:hypothetical protein
MSIEKDRLLSLIEFSQQSARLRGKPAATVAAHGLFALYEHEIQGLPGIHINVNGPDSEDEIWLTIERLHETRPPDIAGAVLRPWVQMTQAPTEEPRLREATDGASLIAAGTHCSSLALAARGRSPSFTKHTESVRSGDVGSQILSDPVLGADERSVGRAVASRE